MTDKPLEWVEHSSGTSSRSQCHETGICFIAWKNCAWYITECFAQPQDVPGTFDGTIETAKQRCEEHLMKLMEVEAGS